MKLSRFNHVGIQRFTEYLDQLENESDAIFPSELLTFPGYSEVLDQGTDIGLRIFKTRFDTGKYLLSLMDEAGIVEPERDVSLWTWLTAFYFDSVCPKDGKGLRKPRERSAYIPEPEDYRRYYRHLLLGPYLIYRAHRDNPERAMALLCKPPHIITDIEAQIGAYQELVSNRAVVELATLLYYDSATKSTKRGAGGKGPGSPRRLVGVLGQLDLTWDLYAATSDELLKLLPKEFNSYR